MVTPEWYNDLDCWERLNAKYQHEPAPVRARWLALCSLMELADEPGMAAIIAEAEKALADAEFKEAK